MVAKYFLKFISLILVLLIRTYYIIQRYEIFSKKRSHLPTFLALRHLERWLCRIVKMPKKRNGVLSHLFADRAAAVGVGGNHHICSVEWFA